MIVFESDQLIIIPTFGFVRDSGRVRLVFSWLWYGVSFKL